MEHTAIWNDWSSTVQKVCRASYLAATATLLKCGHLLRGQRLGQDGEQVVGLRLRQQDGLGPPDARDVDPTGRRRA